MTTETERYYHHRAAEYDRVYDKPERQADIEALRRLVLDPLAGRRVLEVAAGTGYWTQYYADRADAVLATDLQDATLGVARGRRRWPPHVEFAVADAFDPVSIPGEHDAVFAGFLWSHISLDRLDRFVAGLVERVPPGSTLAFADNNFVAGSNHPISRTDDLGNTYQQRTLDDGSRWEVLKNFPTRAELHDRLAPHGVSVRIVQLEYFWFAVLRV